MINVALSRAKARLVILLSRGDRENSLFNRLVESEWCHVALDIEDAIDIFDLAAYGDFPSNAVGKKVKIQSPSGRIVYGRVEEVIDGGSKLKLLDLSTFRERTFMVSTIKEKAKSRLKTKKTTDARSSEPTKRDKTDSLVWLDLCRDLIRRNLRPQDEEWEKLKSIYAKKKGMSMPSNKIIYRTAARFLGCDVETAKKKLRWQ